MNESSPTMGLRDYARLVRERRLLIIVVTLVFAGASVVFTLRQPKVYEASASLQYLADNVEPTVPVIVPGLTESERAAFFAHSVTSREIAERAQKVLGANIPIPVLQHAVRARPEVGTLLVIVSARAAKPQFASLLANAFAQAAKDQTQDDVRATYAAAAKERQALINPKSAPAERAPLQTSVARLQMLSVTSQPVAVIDQATPPASPISPNRTRNVVLGTLLGIVVGLVAASVRNAFERRFASVHEIEDRLGLPVLGFLAEEALGRTVIGSGKGSRSLTRADWEAAQIVLANVELLNVDAHPRVILVTSATASEGKTTVAAALAAGCELIGKHTLLVECDLRNPALAERVGAVKSPGFSDYVAGRAPLVDVVQKVDINAPSEAAAGEPASLSCIVAGSPVPQPVSLLRSDKAHHFFETAASNYDVVVIDTPPLLPVADTTQLIPSAEAVLLCLRASKTTRNQAGAAKTLLERFPDPAIGIVLTGLRLADDAEQYPSAYVYGGAGKRR